jgi:hypothetical protein
MPRERPYSHLRASDADRERVAQFLREQHAVGRLNHEELEERLGRAYRAVTMGDLDRLIGDLPQPNRPASRHVAPRRRHHHPSRALLPMGFAALLVFTAPTLALVMFAVLAAMGLAVLVSVFAIGMALGPFLIVGLLVMLALRRARRPPRHAHWRYY